MTEACSTCGKEADMLFYGTCRACQIDSYDYGDECDDDEDGLDECAMTSDGYCMLAGTEYCEWECPIACTSFSQTPHQPKDGGHG